MKSIFLHIFLILSILTVGAGCMRDDISGLFDEEGEGVRDVPCEMVFSPVLNALDGTRTAGNALNHINSLCVVVYRSDTTFLKAYVYDPATGRNDFGKVTITDNDKTSPSDALEDGHQAEVNTPKATFTIPKMEFGQYYIYAVANMGDLSGYDLSQPHNLKQLKLTWDKDNISANDQMFGYFTSTEAMKSEGFDAPLVTVNSQLPGFHAWLKRAASKVTVAIDGSGLKDGVKVYIKSMQVRDIPKFCYLGQSHKAADHLLLEAEGEKIVVSNTSGAAGDYVDKSVTFPKNMSAAHTPDANAMFFYENMQGTGQLKHQSWNGTSIKYPNGNTPGDNGYKDKKISGTYVEVIGWYVSTNPEKKGSGPIVYRFMLGKDTEKDYNAERNYHYKLTLKLRNWANDADWHIVYDQEPSATASSQYISYLYGESMMMPIKIMGNSIQSITLSIPIDATNKKSWSPVGASGTGTDSPYFTGTVDDPGPWDGFLQLSPMTDETVTAPSGTPYYTYNKTYFQQSGKYRDTRKYTNIKAGVKTTSLGDSYEVKTNGAGEWTVMLPLYTRSRVMVAASGYTGNNLFTGYNRTADVTFTVEVKDKDGTVHTIEKTVAVNQVQRVVNPKGIWRPHNSVAPFHIQMMATDAESMGTSIGSNFYKFASVGPWHAEIEVGDWFSIEPTPGVSQQNPDGSISGIGDPYDADNYMDFTFRPKGTIASHKARGGIIKISYNNNTCVHRIFVRQGYAPVQMYEEGPYWHSKNLLTASKEAANPVVEGSYFRLYNLALPIAASNNTVARFFKDGMSKDFTIQGKTATKKWNGITTTKKQWDAITINGVSCRLPKPEECDKILTNENTIFGYGVLYTENCDKTITNVNNAYGAREADYTSGRGIRGVFVCDKKTGDQLFFPIGASGFGRFKQYSPNGGTYRLKKGLGGVIQYAARWEFMTDADAKYRPLLWDIYRRQGAIYWTATNNVTERAMDVNYYSLNMQTATAEGDLGLVYSGSAGATAEPDASGSDAIFIRLVQDRKPTATNPGI